MYWEYSEILNIYIEHILKYINIFFLRPKKFQNIAKFPIFLLRIYLCMLTSVLLEQIFWEYCENPYIYIENILKNMDFFLLKLNLLGIFRNSQY